MPSTTQPPGSALENKISLKSHTTKKNHLKETKTILKQAMKYITLVQT
jgi:hypothetical protein